MPNCLDGAYIVAIQAGTGYALTTPASVGITVLVLPGAQVNGVIYFFHHGKPAKLVDPGKPTGSWSFVDITGLLRGSRQEILFQEQSTGKAFAWILDEDLKVASIVDLNIGKPICTRSEMSACQERWHFIFTAADNSPLLIVWRRRSTHSYPSYASSRVVAT